MPTGSRIFSGSSFEELAGYARAVVLPDPGGDWVMVSGTTGFDYEAGTISDDVAEQTHQTFVNIERALKEADCSFADAVRIRVYVAHQEQFETVAGIVGEYMRDVRPANTSVVAALVDPRMLVEIEITARRPAASGGPVTGGPSPIRTQRRREEGRG